MVRAGESDIYTVDIGEPELGSVQNPENQNPETHLSPRDGPRYG
jgi:hypothetical protein